MNFDQLLEPMGIHLFHCAHGGDRIEFYNVVWMFLHPLREILDFMFCKNKSTFSRPLPFIFFCWWVDIVLLIDNICTLVDVIIVAFTWTDFVSQATFSQRVATSLVVQVKKGFSCDYYSIDVFLPFVIEGFLCFHQQAHNFFHQCANMAWTIKGNKGLPLSVLHSFYKQRILIAL